MNCMNCNEPKMIVTKYKVKTKAVYDIGQILNTKSKDLPHKQTSTLKYMFRKPLILA